jgi:hypothetical protein
VHRAPARLCAAAIVVAAPCAALTGTGDARLNRGCDDMAGSTVARNDHARIVERGYYLLGCLYRDPDVVRLFPTRDDDGGLCGTIGAVRLRREKVAFAYDNCGGAGTVYVAIVKVVDLRSKRVLHRRYSPQDEGSSIESLVLKRDGSAGWIRNDCPDPPTCNNVVLKADHTHRHRLDSGPDIDPHSLVLHGSTMSWTKAGVRRSATLD